MNKLHFLLVIGLLSIFTSCKRGINLDEIKAMEAGAAKESAMCYYENGFVLGQPLQAMEEFEIRSKPNVKIDADIAVNKGDSIIPISLKVIPTEKSEYTMAELHIIRDGKIVAEGWIPIGVFADYIGPFAWTSVLYDWDGWLISIIVFGIFIIGIHRLWLWLYGMIQERRNKPDCTDCDFKFIFFFLASSLALGGMFTYLAFNKEITASLFYNPDITAHWSEYPFVVKLLPFLILFFVITSIGMLVEMIVKMKSGWAILHFIGWFSIGATAIALTVVLSWIIYMLIAAFGAFIVFGLLGGGGSDEYVVVRRSRW